MKKLTIALFVLTLALISCKKEEKIKSSGSNGASSNGSSQSVVQKLSNKNWKVTNSTINPAYDFGNGLTTDLYSQYLACEKDDYYIFYTDFNTIRDKRGTLCTSGEDQTEYATWSLNSDKTVLYIGSISLNILSISSNSMIHKSYQTIDGATYTITDTYGL